VGSGRRGVRAGSSGVVSLSWLSAGGIKRFLRRLWGEGKRLGWEGWGRFGKSCVWARFGGG
jgi:hypothetical protein